MRTILFVGDLTIFVFSLWLTIALRYVSLPSIKSFATLEIPFFILFLVWILVFVMSGLYDKRTLVARRLLPDKLVRIQILNITLAALFFFFVPGFGVTPKTILIIYLAVSLVLILAWRLTVFPYISKRRWRQKSIIIGSGDEVHALAEEINTGSRYSIVCHKILNPKDLSEKDLYTYLEQYKKDGVSSIVVDVQEPEITKLLPTLYHAVFEDRTFYLVPLIDVYEDVFERVPLSLLRYDWMFTYVARTSSFTYSLLKRLVDIVGGVVMGFVTILVIPFIWITMHIEAPGKLFITQERFGMHGSRMRVYKFRTMSFNDNGAWSGENKNYVTRVGAFLRQTSLDEFPQFINILRGDLSLVGPRNDIVALGERLVDALPYYTVRYLVKPGITGWAQVNQQYEHGNISPQSIDETKTRLAYDFYYIKHRSFMLDVVISLKTIKRMIFRIG